MMKRAVKIFILLLAVLLVFKIFGRNLKSLPEKNNSPEILSGLKGKMVFQSDRTGNDEIFIMTADGRGLRPITRNNFSDETPAFSPDGEKIVFVSDRFGNRDIFVSDLNGRILNRITQTPEDEFDPVWSASGDKIYFSAKKEGPEDIYVYSFSSKKIDRLTKEKWRQILPAIAPDGRKLALSANKGWGWQIYLKEGAGGGLIQLTKKGGNCRPVWSPDGRQMAFVSTRDDRKGDIYLMKADGSETVRVTNDPKTHDYDPAFSPDGKYLVFSKTINKTKAPENLWVVELETGRTACLTSHHSKNKFPDWK